MTPLDTDLYSRRLPDQGFDDQGMRNDLCSILPDTSSPQHRSRYGATETLRCAIHSLSGFTTHDIASLSCVGPEEFFSHFTICMSLSQPA